MNRSIFSICLSIAFIFALLLRFSVCQATIPQEKIAIGGIMPGDSVSKVFEMYGPPSTYNDKAFFYGEGIEILHNNGYVKSVAVASYIWTTADGVKTGMYASVLNEVYGKADKVTKKKNDYTRYFYYTPVGNVLCFCVVENTGKIRLISNK